MEDAGVALSSRSNYGLGEVVGDSKIFPSTFFP
jgi:hypothetical protein